MRPALVLQNLSTIGLILVTMAALSLLEWLVALHPRGRWSVAHLGPNLGLTALTLATNLPLNLVLVTALAWAQGRHFGLLGLLDVGSVPAMVLSVAALDLSFYALHVAMHKVSFFWRFHRVHHSDPMVDVTTTIRQHPGESLLRYASLAIVALAIGASPGAFAVYRVSSVIGGLLEHANIRVPLRLSALLAWLTTWPDLHKIHHSSAAAQTDSNYGNLFSCWDRMFSTFTPISGASEIAYGLDGLDDPRSQALASLLTLPFARAEPVDAPGHCEAANGSR